MFSGLLVSARTASRPQGAPQSQASFNVALERIHRDESVLHFQHGCREMALPDSDVLILRLRPGLNVGTPPNGCGGRYK